MKINLLTSIFGYFRSIEKPQNAVRDRYHKGRPRPYAEAKGLSVIDANIAYLVDAMNIDSIIRTTGSCQGHGAPIYYGGTLYLLQMRYANCI